MAQCTASVTLLLEDSLRLNMKLGLHIDWCIGRWFGRENNVEINFYLPTIFLGYRKDDDDKESDMTAFQAIGVLESLKYDLLNAMREANTEEEQ